MISKNFSKLASFFHDLQTEDNQQQSTINSTQQQQMDLLLNEQQMNDSVSTNMIKFLGQNRKPITIVKTINNSSNLNKLTMSYDTRLDTSVSQTIENYLFIKSGYQIDLINRSIIDPLPLILLQKQCLTNNNEVLATTNVDQEQSTVLIQSTIENLFNNLEQTNI
jgi:hypothetical protein